LRYLEDSGKIELREREITMTNIDTLVTASYTFPDGPVTVELPKPLDELAWELYVNDFPDNCLCGDCEQISEIWYLLLYRDSDLLAKERVGTAEDWSLEATAEEIAAENLIYFIEKKD
jgi:hypothetical protein